MRVAANKNASRRTRNRIAEHPNFVPTGQSSNSVIGFGGKLMLGFVEHGTSVNGNDYGCWLPADEVEIIE